MTAPPITARFRALFDAEIGFVCRILQRLGVHERDVPDVAQELFLAVNEKLASNDVDGDRSWLYAYCVRYASNYRKLARHRERMDSDQTAEGSRTNTASRARGDDFAARDLVHRALHSLDHDKREALVLHDMEGLSAPEIADITGTPLNTVYSRVRLARESFRKAVGTLEGAAP
jgi:RNA polymerase sigma-70 factor (ECF subfamily)